MSIESYLEQKRAMKGETNAEMLIKIRQARRLKPLQTECPNCHEHTEFKYVGKEKDKYTGIDNNIYECRECGKEETGYFLIIYRSQLEEKNLK